MRKSIILAVLCVAGAALAPAAVAQSSKTQNAVNHHVHHRHHAVSEAYAKQNVRPRQPSTPKGECNWPQTNLYNNPC